MKRVLNRSRKTENKFRKGTFKGALFTRLFGLGLLLMALIYFFLPFNILVAQNFQDGNILRVWKCRKSNKTFTIAYTHSVMLSEVTETYGLKRGDIILLESSFKDYGAGLPSSTPYDFEIDGKGLFKIYNIGEKIRPLVYRTGAERAQHRILINGQAENFLDFSKPREGVEFTTARTNNLSLLLKGGYYFD